jgi:hypothetical protein
MASSKEGIWASKESGAAILGEGMDTIPFLSQLADFPFLGRELQVPAPASPAEY